MVFYTGFTRECIDGQGPSPKELLDKIEEAVNTIAKGKKVRAVTPSTLGVWHTLVRPMLTCPATVCHRGRRWISFGGQVCSTLHAVTWCVMAKC